MPLSQFDQSKLDLFFKEIEGFQAAYRHSHLRYLALRSEDKWLLLHAAVALSASPVDIPRPFATEDVCAGIALLADVTSSPQELLNSLLADGLQLDGKLVVLPPEHTGNHSAQSWSFDGEQHDRDAAGGVRIAGANNSHLMHREAIIRQVKSGHPSFHSVVDLAKYYGMAFDMGSGSFIELRASSVVRAEAARLELGRANIRFRVCAPLAADGARIGLRASDSSERSVSMPDIVWEDGSGGGHIGTVDVSLPDARTALFILNYGGFVQEKVEVSEPAHLHNALLFVHDIFDHDDKGFARAINERKLTDRESNPFESTVAALLSLSGFRVMAVDRVPHLNGIPDIVAADAAENILLVECTLDLPHADNKLSRLSNRRRAIREKLDEAGLTDTQALAVLAVALPCKELDEYYRDADRAGVILWGREDLHALRESKGTRSAETLFDELAAQQTGAFADLYEPPEYE